MKAAQTASLKGGDTTERKSSFERKRAGLVRHPQALGQEKHAFHVGHSTGGEAMARRCYDHG